MKHAAIPVVTLSLLTAMSAASYAMSPRSSAAVAPELSAALETETNSAQPDESEALQAGVDGGAQGLRPYACGRLLREPTEEQKTNPSVVLTGLTCAWVCAESSTQAAEFCKRPRSHPGLKAYPTAVAAGNCNPAARAPIRGFDGCCRPDPYNDWGIVSNGADTAGAPSRTVVACGRTR